LAPIYRPPPLNDRDNPNVGRSHPLRDLIVLALGTGGAVVIIAIILGWTINLLVPLVPQRYEARLFGWITVPNDDEVFPAETERLHRIFTMMQPHLPPSELTAKISVVNSETPNAMTLPGGQIVFTSGLTTQASSDNELAMILGHELGHLYNRDHLRGIGMGLSTTLLTSALSFDEAGGFITNLLGLTSMSFSRDQEQAADRFGLDMLYATYNSAHGATEFFDRMAAQNDEGGGLGELFATHPLSEGRARNLRELIGARNGQ